MKKAAKPILTTDSSVRDQLQISGIRLHSSLRSRNLSFSDFVNTLQEFDCSGLLTVASILSWEIWLSPSTFPEPDDIGICRIYMPTIAALAVATCHDSVNPRFPTELDVRQLALELLGVSSPITETHYRDQVELPALKSALSSSTPFQTVRFDIKALRAIHALVSFARDIRAQWSFRTNYAWSIFRGWKIATFLDRRAKGFLHAVARLWNVELAHLALCGMTLLAMAQESRGLVSLSQPRALDSLPAKYGIDADVVKLVANRISRAPSEYQAWYQTEVLGYPELLRKYAASPLVATPLVSIEGSFKHIRSPLPAFAVPSPAHLMWYFQSAPFEAVQALSNSWDPDLRGKLGSAVSDYVYWMLCGTCGQENVISLDALFATADSAHADFAVIADNYVLIIESKTSVGNVEAKTVISMQHYVDIWERIWSAYAQCISTTSAAAFRLEPRLSSTTKFAYLVTFEEHICLEGAGLNAVAAAEGVFSSHHMTSIEAVTLQSLEDLLVQLGPKGLAETIEAKWTSGRHGEGLDQYVARRRTPGQPFSDRGYARADFLKFFKMEKVFKTIQERDRGG